MAEFDQIDQIDSGSVALTEAMLGYNILVDGEFVGSIEGIPGRIEYLVVQPNWQGKGIARTALNEFVSLSRKQGASKVTTNNAIHDAMEHILKTEGFTKQPDEGEWEKQL
jgi:GNAT superfamily N-acetyltransferase